jgi:membrane-associated phospholipid phosphatase
MALINVQIVMKRLTITLTLCCLHLFAAAQIDSSISGAPQPLPDTPHVASTGVGIVDSIVKNAVTPIRPKGLSWKPVVIPLAMITYGAIAVNNNLLKSVNTEAHELFYLNRRNQNRFHLDDYTIYAPAVAAFGLNLAGVKGKNNMLDKFFLYAVSNAFCNGFVFSTKKLTNVSRPDGSDNFSFPSGHTAAAFVSAEFLRQEYKDVSPWIGVAGYICATGTGFLRIYNNKHWFNDVIAGAGIGILSTRLSYFIYPKLKNLIIRKANKQAGISTIILPTYANGMVGISLVKSL